jgi:hypothetical protein
MGPAEPVVDADRHRDRSGRRRQILAVDMANRESCAPWKDFLLGLRRRGPGAISSPTIARAFA